MQPGTTPYRAGGPVPPPTLSWWQRLAVFFRVGDPARFPAWRRRRGGRWVPVPRGLAWYVWSQVTDCPATWPETPSLAGRSTWREADVTVHRALRAQCRARCVCEVWGPATNPGVLG